MPTSPITISGAVANQATTDQASIDPFASVTITDPNAGQNEMVSVTLSSAANGTLSNLDGGNYDAATGVYTVSGSADAVTAALDGLVFTPTSGQVPPGQSVTTSFTIVDTDTAGATVTNRTTTVLAAPIVPPVISGGGAMFGTVQIDSTAAFTVYGGITITDENFGQTDTATVTLSPASSGSLLPLSGAGVYDPSAGTYTVSGDAVEVEHALRNLELSVPNGATVTLTLTVAETDGASTTSTTTVIETPPPPATTITISGAVAGQGVSDPGSIAPFTGVTIADSFFLAPSQTATVTLSSAGNGTLSNLGGGSYNAATGVYTVSGTVAEVTSAIDGLVFTPNTGLTPGFTTTFTITDSDGSDSATNSTTTVITGPAVVPVISGTISSQTTIDLVSVTPFKSVTIRDPNLGVTTETVTVALSSAGNGVLSNLGGGNYDSATGVYTVSGSAAAVTAALDGLVFTPTEGQVAFGHTVITDFTILDTDAANATVTDSATSVIATAVGVAITGAVAGQSTTDQATITPFGGVTILDVNPAQTDTLTVTLSSAGNGELSNLGGGSYDAATGIYTVSGTAAAVTSALDGLVFTPTFQQVAAGQTVTTTFTLADTGTSGSTAIDTTTTVTATAVVLNTLVTFDGTDGAQPETTLVIDGSGNLYGETDAGGASNLGTLFELTKIGGLYASTPDALSPPGSPNTLTPDTGLVAGTQEVMPHSNLFMDAAGDVVFSTVSNAVVPAAAGHTGSVILEQAGSVAPVLLAGIAPLANLKVWAPQVTLVTTQGTFVTNLLGTEHLEFFTAGFSGIAGDSETILSVTGVTGSMVADTAGNVYGTTSSGGANSDGSVFELLNGSYAGTPITLASFNGTNGADPQAGLISDAAGNLFGTTLSGGAYNDGTVFELVNNGGGSYTLESLASFDGADGANPDGGLIEDAAGNLYGATEAGGAGDGTVFKIANTAGAYASTPTTLVTFDGTNGASPETALTVDSSGNLFGTTASGGADSDGTLFELSDAGYVLPPQILSSGEVLSGVTVGSTKAVVVENGARILSSVVDVGGVVRVSSGGTASDLSISSGGTLLVLAGGTADPTIISGGGTEIVSSGGTDLGAQISGGSQFDFGLASGTTVFAGALIVESGGSAPNTIVKSGGTEILYSGGSTPGLTLSSGATLELVDGAAAPVALAAGDILLVGSGTRFSGTVSKGVTVEVLSGGVDSGATVAAGGKLTIFAGGTDSGAKVSGGTEIVSSGAVANGTIVKAGGAEIVAAGGTLSGVTISGGGTEIVSAGGTDHGGAQISGGTQLDYGMASGATIAKAGTEIIFSGGSAVGVAILSGGTEIVSRGGVATSNTVRSGGTEIVSAGGTANGTSVASGGRLIVTSGGLGVLSSGSILASGGPVSAVTVSRGGVFEFVGIDADHAPVNFLSGASAALGSGAFLSGAQISTGITLVVLSGGTAFGGSVAAGGLVVLESGSVVSSGGVSGSLVVSSGGTLEYVGLNANSASGNVNFRSGATVELGSGASITGAAGELAAGHTARILSAGTATDITIDSGAKAFVQSGGSAVDLAVLSGGSAVISTGGVFDVVTSAANSGTLVDSGAVDVSSGGVLTLSGVTSVGGGAVVEALSGGTALVAGTVTNGGTLFAGSSGSVIEIASGAVVNGGVAEVGDGLVAILGSSSENVSFFSNGDGGLAICRHFGSRDRVQGAGIRVRRYRA
jgi:autotransporter passenger strand-loop-strand repeat protein/uncharacterized repeat protein (TIGR03803 family)